MKNIFVTIIMGLLCFSTAAEAQMMQGPPDLWAGQVTRGNPIVIHFSPGGVIQMFVEEFGEIAARGTMVVIDGPCMSACTMATSLPNVCATPNGILGFHEGFDMLPGGRRRVDPQATNLMASHWSAAARNWVRRHGPLTLNIKQVRADQIVPPCGSVVTQQQSPFNSAPMTQWRPFGHR